MLKAEQAAARVRAVRNAIAHQRLEGLEPPARVIAQLEQYARGECEINDIINDIRAGIASERKVQR